MEAKDKIITGKVRLQKDNAFFSYLVMSLNTKEESKVNTCAVDGKGNLYYAPKFIDKLNNNEVKTLLCHEVLHIALLHLLRVGERDREIWNIANDLVTNNILVNEKFDFTGELKHGIVPNNNQIKFDTKPALIIKDIDKKIVEEIYVILNQKLYKDQIKKMYAGNGFDKHIYSENKDGQSSISKQEQEELEKEWKKRLAEATTYAKQRGNLPLGMERYIDELLQVKLNWRELLYRYITQEIPFDYSYNRPSKRSQAIGLFMPKVKKELIDISVAVDVSGSIGKEELQEFLTEIIGISKSFDSIRINLFFMDTQVNNHYVLLNGEEDRILDYEIKGGGGTDFRSCYKYVEENIPNTRLLVFFTDLYATFPIEETYKTIWVVTKNGDSKDAPFGETIRLE